MHIAIPRVHVRVLHAYVLEYVHVRTYVHVYQVQHDTGTDERTTETTDEPNQTVAYWTFLDDQSADYMYVFERGRLEQSSLRRVVTYITYIQAYHGTRVLVQHTYIQHHTCTR